MTISKRNPLLATDVYKMGHMEQYAPGVTKVYSYLTTRSEKNFSAVKWFGLNYYLEEFFKTTLTFEMGEEFLKYRAMILGANSPAVEQKIRALCALGKFPLEIKALPEGITVPVGTPLLTITNTLPEFYWVVGFVESLLLKVWYSTTVASCCAKYRGIVDRYFEKTVDESLGFLRDYTVHDFGYRGDSSEESAAISGCAHLLSFKGSDTVVAYPFAEKYYPEMGLSMASVPASEHSVMCSFGRDGELEAFKHMLATYPTGIVSIVSDTYSIWNVLSTFAVELKDHILARDGKVVFRPDSGNPKDIICGTKPDAIDSSPEGLGAIRLLDKIFGHTVNEKGFKVLNPKVGLIYGDGMYYERYRDTLQLLEDMGYAASNLVIGVGGILRNHSRDTLGFALKATYVEVNGEPRAIMKDPITDQTKKSAMGLLRVNSDFSVTQNCSWIEEKQSLLKTVYLSS